MPAGRYTNVALTANWHRLRVDGIGGTNYLLGAQLLLGHTNGVHVAFTSYGGISLSAVTNVPRAIRDPIMAALKPDLLIWQMKESADMTMSNQMNECENWWRASNPDGEVIYIGTPWTQLDTNGAYTPDHNRIERGVAVAHDRAYADLMQPAVSYSWMVAQGYMQDAVHLNSAGGQWGANVMWDDLGFFALDLPRKLGFERLGQNLGISFATSTGITYTVQSSGDFQNWASLGTLAGTGQRQTNQQPVTTNLFFRLKLQPAS
jgi:hypothetical protein